MKFWSPLIPLFTAASLSIAIPSLEAKPKKDITQKTQDGVVKILSEQESARYLPSPTRVPKFTFPDERGANTTPQIIELSTNESLTGFFQTARSFMEEKYKYPTDWEHLYWAYHSDYKNGKNTSKDKWVIIPFIIVEQNDLNPEIWEASKKIKGKLVHLARRQNPSPTWSKDWVLEWNWTLEKTDLTAEITGIAASAKTEEEASIKKSNGAGTPVSFYDGSNKQYVVLASKYPLFQEPPKITTPFSRGAITKPIFQAGFEYFSRLKEQWFADLKGIAWWERNKEMQSIVSDTIGALLFVENMNVLNLGLTKNYRKEGYKWEFQKVLAELCSLWVDWLKKSSPANAKWPFQITFKAWSGYKVFNKTTWQWESKPGLKDSHSHPLFSNTTVSDNEVFNKIVLDHRSAIVLAHAHIVRQIEEYKNKPKAYKWLTWEWAAYAIYIIAAGYNSNNTHRSWELEQILTIYPSLTPKEIVKKFYLWITMGKYWNPNETRWYLKKLEEAIGELKLPYAPMELY